MELAAFDPATRTGWAVGPAFHGNTRPNFEVGSWQLPEKSPVHECCEHLAAHAVLFFGRHKVEFVAIEVPQSGLHEKEQVIDGPMGPEKIKKPVGNIKTQNRLWAYHGALVAVVSSLRIPYRVVSVGEWRKSVFGKWHISSEEAKDGCKQLLYNCRIHCANADAAEAGGIFFYLNGHYRRWLQEDDILRSQHVLI